MLRRLGIAAVLLGALVAPGSAVADSTMSRSAGALFFLSEDAGIGNRLTVDIASGDRLRFADDADPFGAHVAVRVDVERVAASRGGQCGERRSAELRPRRQQRVDPGDDREVTLVCPKGPHPQMHGHQGGGAGGVHGHAGTSKVPVVGEPVGDQGV